MIDIHIDSREASKHPEFKSILEEKGLTVSTGLLDCGDFMIYNSEEDKAILIERKSIGDFIGSMMSGRIFEQLERLKAVNAKPMILVEGSFAQGRRYGKVNVSSILGCLVNIELKWGVPIVTLPSKKWTPYYLLAIANCLGKPKRPYALRGGAPRKMTLRQKQEYLLSGLPSVGPTTSRGLLEYFKSPLTLFTHLEQLEEVKGVGKKIAHDIMEVIIGGE